MSLLLEAIAWILDPEHYGGEAGIDTRLLQQIGISILVLVIAAVIAIPVGFTIGHTGRGKALAVVTTGTVRALPTLGLLTLIALAVGIGLTAPLIALVVLAIPSILAGAYSGFEAVDRRTIDAARAMGMTELQIVFRVELPLGLPLLIGGLRSAMLQVVATATLAAYVGAGGLGGYIFSGIRSRDYPQMIAGSILVLVLALFFEGAFTALQKLVVPAGVKAGRRQNVSARSTRPRAAAV